MSNEFFIFVILYSPKKKNQLIKLSTAYIKLILMATHGRN